MPVALILFPAPGNIIVFLPTSYAGTIALHAGRDISKKTVQFLPQLAQRAHVVRKSVREVVLSLHGGTPAPATAAVSSAQQQEDSCVISTRTGKVAVGLFGADEEARWDEEDVLHRFGRAVEVGLLGANYYL